MSKPVSDYTSLAGVGGARVRYERLGKKLNNARNSARGESRSLRRGMKAERRALEREWGSAIRGGGLDKGSVAAAKKKAKENPSSWYLGGSKPSILGMTYYYLNRHKPYTLFFTVRPPREEKFPTHLHGRKPRKTRVTLYRLTPFGLNDAFNPWGISHAGTREEDWWRGLDPSKPLRSQATKSPIRSKVHADKEFYHSGHLSSLKYQALDWADSVIFTPAERLGLL